MAYVFLYYSHPPLLQRIRAILQYQKTITDERYALEKLSPEAFDQEQILLRAKRTWLKEENEKLQVKLSNLKKYKVKRDMIEQVRENLRANLDKASNEDWRFILECLGTKIMAFGDGTWGIEINIPATEIDKTPDPIESKISCDFASRLRRELSRMLRANGLSLFSQKS